MLAVTVADREGRGDVLVWDTTGGEFGRPVCEDGMVFLGCGLAGCCCSCDDGGKDGGGDDAEEGRAEYVFRTGALCCAAGVVAVDDDAG